MMILNKRQKRFYLHLLGMGIVAVWLVMIGLLVKKVHFRRQPGTTGTLVPATKIDSFRREWREIYFQDKKVGYAVHMIKPFEKGYFIQEEIFLKLNLMGLASGVYSVTQCKVDQDFLLKSFHFNMTSGVVKFNIRGRVEDHHLIIEKGKGKALRTQRIKLSKPPMIGAGIGPFFQSQRLEVGQTFKLPIFDPSTMAQTETVIKVVAREPVEINRITYNTFRLETELWGKPLTFWIDEDGTTLKEEGFMGLTTVKSSAANAPRNLAAGGDLDLYEMTAVQVDRYLPKPTNLVYLKIEMEGIDHATLNKTSWHGGRQKFHNGVVEITREKLPLKASYRLPYQGEEENMRRFLEPEINIESDHREIIKTARQIAGKDHNPISVARRLMSWVYHNLDKRPVVSVPSALEVLKTRVGDCNEHATLLTAFLRAMGIPARLSIGLVYTRGKFFYHAWTEAFVGEWVSMDATLNQMPVDATHVKFLEGNLDKQVEIAGLIGTLKKIMVLDYR